MNVIDVNNLGKSFGSRLILDSVAFAVDETEKVGLIGMNGSGKSTLFSILAGLDEKDSGNISFRRGATVGFLPQEPVLDDRLTVAEEIEQGLKDIRSALSEFNQISARLSQDDPDMERLLVRQGELVSWIEHHGGWNIDHRVSDIMGRLGIPHRDQRIGELSGGTKRRVALARLLLQAPDLLLLDEPTNHLDADTIQWLQGHLKSYEGAVFLVTHDRYFLDEVVGRILELDNGRISSYNCGYSIYLEQKEERLAQDERAKSRLLNLFRMETAWMRRGAKARTTKQKARIGRYETLREELPSVETRTARFDFSMEDGLGGTVLDLLGLDKSFDGQTILKNLTFRLKRGERVGIIGPNGCGKSTLLRMVMGEEQPDNGAVVVGKKTHIAYFDQKREILEPEETIYAFLGEGDYVEVGGEKRHKIGYLEDFLFSPADRMRQVKTLSGGEKSRLILAKLMLAGANLLILDEPTNDMDIPTLQLLEQALTGFPGAVLVVTHDRFFMDKVATSILAFEGEGAVTRYVGNYSMYRELKEQARSASVAALPAKDQQKTAAPARRQEKPRKGLTYAERMELERVEEDIAAMEERKVEVEASLADPASYDNAQGGIAALSDEFARLESELAALYARWEELETKKQEAPCQT